MTLCYFNLNKLNYKVEGNRNKSCILLLPPGPGNSESLGDLADILKKRHFVISVDFPGAGTSVFKEAKLKTIILGIEKIIKKEKIEKIICIGESYGGTVAVELSKKVKLDRIILIGTGEYFSLPIKIIYTMLFIPALLSRRIRRFYLSKIPGAFKMLFDIDVSYLKDISPAMMQNLLVRFYEILWYKLDTSFNSKTHSLLISTEGVDSAQTECRAELNPPMPKASSFV